MYDGTNFMGIKGYDQCQFFESDVILGASGEHEIDFRSWGSPYMKSTFILSSFELRHASSFGKTK